MSHPYKQPTTNQSSQANNINLLTLQKHKEQNNRDITEAYTLYAEKLVAYCNYRVASHEAAEDITQEAFIRAWQYLEKNNIILHLKSFLYTTTRHLIVDEYRKKKTLPISLIEPPESESHALFNFQNDLYRSTDARQITCSIEKLSHTYKKVLTLRYIYDYSVTQIAEDLHISQNVASVRIYRGLKELRSLVDTNAIV